MTRTRRVLTVISALIVLSVASLMVALSHNAPCTAPDAVLDGKPQMTAITRRCYGSAEVLRIEKLEKPVPADHQILVRVRAISINPVDWHVMTATPYIMRLSEGVGTPDDSRLGTDFAGTVEAVGRNVKRFKPGDDVFGVRHGALAEYVTVSEQGSVVLKPANVGFEQAAAIPVAAVTALQALRDKGKVQPGQKVLINGASGGVGTFAVQLAKHFGAEVTGVCSTRNVDLVRGIGADKVIDYTRESFTQGAERYDLIVDNVGNHSPLELRRVMKPDGVVVMVGGPKTGKWIGPLSRPIQATLLSPFIDERFETLFAEVTPDDLKFLSELAQQGKLTPVIDRRYRFTDTPDAM